MRRNANGLHFSYTFYFVCSPDVICFLSPTYMSKRFQCYLPREVWYGQYSSSLVSFMSSFLLCSCRLILRKCLSFVISQELTLSRVPVPCCSSFTDSQLSLYATPAVLIISCTPQGNSKTAAILSGQNIDSPNLLQYFGRREWRGCCGVPLWCTPGDVCTLRVVIFYEYDGFISAWWR